MKTLQCVQFSSFFLCLVLAVNLDFNTKLQGLVNELRGEIGATLRGSRDAKDRLLKSEYIVKQYPCKVIRFNSMKSLHGKLKINLGTKR